MDRPTGLPMVLILECRSHLDLGDLPNLLAAELGVMTVRLERAIRSLDGVARVHVNRWGDGSAHLHMWFLARPYGRLQLRGTFLSLWDDILPTIPEQQWRENLALVAAWLAEFGGRANAEPPHIQWQSPSTFSDSPLRRSPPSRNATTSARRGSRTTLIDDAEPAASGAGSKTDSPSSGASTAAPDTTTGDDGASRRRGQADGRSGRPQQPDNEFRRGRDVRRRGDMPTRRRRARRRSEDQAQPHATRSRSAPEANDSTDAC